MKRIKFTLLFLIFIYGNLFAQNEVKIGEQIWMTKNLDVVTFRNGDTIPEAKSDVDWMDAGKNEQPAWCYYENKSENNSKFGKLYNWYAVNDARGLAPDGWSVPTIKNLDSLSNFLRKNDKECEVLFLKSDWLCQRGSNETGFTAKPSGGRFDYEFSGSYREGWGLQAYFWSRSERSDINYFATYYELSERTFFSIDQKKSFGLSVRCIKN